MNIRQIDIAEKDKWDDFVSRSPFGHLFQTFEWGEVAKRLGWYPIRLALEENGEFKALASLLCREKSLGKTSFLYVPRGPIFDMNNPADFYFLVGQLKKVAQEKKAVSLKINPAIEKISSVKQIYRASNFVPSPRREMHVCTYRINLDKTIDELWVALKGRTRTAIRTAERKQVMVKNSDSMSNLKAFYSLYSSMGRRKDFPVQSFEFFEDVWNKFLPKGQAKVFTAYYEKEAVSTAFLLVFARKCEYLWGAVNDQFRNVSPSQKLHWQIIKWAKQEGLSTYDLGGVPPDPDELPGITLFKSSFGGDFTELIGEYEYAYSPTLCWMWNHLWPKYRKITADLDNIKGNLRQ